MTNLSQTHKRAVLVKNVWPGKPWPSNKKDRKLFCYVICYAIKHKITISPEIRIKEAFFLL